MNWTRWRVRIGASFCARGLVQGRSKSGVCGGGCEISRKLKKRRITELLLTLILGHGGGFGLAHLYSQRDFSKRNYNGTLHSLTCFRLPCEDQDPRDNRAPKNNHADEIEWHGDFLDAYLVRGVAWQKKLCPSFWQHSGKKKLTETIEKIRPVREKLEVVWSWCCGVELPVK